MLPAEGYRRQLNLRLKYARELIELSGKDQSSQAPAIEQANAAEAREQQQRGAGLRDAGNPRSARVKRTRGDRFAARIDSIEL